MTIVEQAEQMQLDNFDLDRKVALDQLVIHTSRLKALNEERDAAIHSVRNALEVVERTYELGSSHA